MLIPVYRKSESIEGLYPLPISDKNPILMPKDWTIYHNDTKADRNSNNKKSIEYYRRILGIIASDDPVESMKIRARILMNLGNRYIDRYSIQGNQPGDIRLAICAYNIALAAFSKDIDPLNWAKVKMNLGAAYGKDFRGNRLENIEKSIDVSLQSLEKMSFEKKPTDWANALMNLGVAYIDRVKGDKSSNVLKAIEDFEKPINRNIYILL